MTLVSEILAVANILVGRSPPRARPASSSAGARAITEWDEGFSAMEWHESRAASSLAAPRRREEPNGHVIAQSASCRLPGRTSPLDWRAWQESNLRPAAFKAAALYRCASR